MPVRFWFLSVLCSVIPDADVVMFSFGIPYGHFWGHRGFFHSCVFGLIFGLIITLVFFYNTKFFSKRWWFYFSFFTIITASHGIFDAFTNGGMGIALLSPFDETRYFFPWTPIRVSPIGLKAFLSSWGLAVFKNELVWIWLPSLMMIVLAFLFKKWSKRNNAIDQQ